MYDGEVFNGKTSIGEFSVGFGKGNITPSNPAGHTILGGGNKISTGIDSQLYAICIAMTDSDGNTAIVMSVDTTNISNSAITAMERWVDTMYDIPQENITISSIHQHSTPAWSTEYQNEALTAMQQAVRTAMNDRAPAEMYINTVQTENLAFVRHYLYTKKYLGGLIKDEFVVTDNYNQDKATGGTYTKHMTAADNDMQLVKFVRDGKDDIILVNFQGHPIDGYECKPLDGSDGYNLHADWPGVMRSEVEEELGANVMYISGAGGNLSSRTRIAGERTYNGQEYGGNDWITHGKKAAGYVVAAEGSYRKVNTGKIESKFITQSYAVDHSEDSKAAAAKEIHEAMNQSEAEAVEVMKKYPNQFSSVHHARSVYQKSQMGDTIDISVGVISVGDVAFSCHQYEMFDTNGVELKKGTVGNKNYAVADQLANPYAMTVIATMAKGTKEYIPSAYADSYGCYEADISKFATGSGEQLVTSYLEILNELHG